jgi:hypothetical protein
MCLPLEILATSDTLVGLARLAESILQHGTVEPLSRGIVQAGGTIAQGVRWAKLRRKCQKFALIGSPPRIYAFRTSPDAPKRRRKI